MGLKDKFEIWTELNWFYYMMKRGNSMEGFFSVDGKGFQFLSTASELVILNILWLLCCIPIVTAGAATTALYAVAIKIVKNEESYVAKSFFHSFRQNFRQATVIWVLMLFVIAVLYFDFYFSAHAPIEGAAILFIPFAIIAVLWLLTMVYVFPIQAVFKNPVRRTLKNALYMALAHLPLSVLAVAAATGPVMIILLLRSNITLAVFLDCVIGCAFFSWVNSHIFVRVFQRYMPEEGESKMV